MVVVPTFAVAEDTEEQVVSGIIARFVIAAADDVADRIDRPSHVV